MKMSELHRMFSYAGITLPEAEIEKLFFRAAERGQKDRDERRLRFKSAESMRYRLRLGVEDMDWDPFKA